MRRATELLLVLLCGLGVAQFAAAQSQPQGATITKIANNSTIVLNGYNATGFENTAEYYGPYSEAEPTATTVPEPDVNVDIVPGCNLLRNGQYAIANYTGAIPCEANNTCHNMTGKVIFITGASTGIGRAAANRFAAAGATVIGTSRWPWRYPTPSWELYEMDQTSSESVKAAMDRVALNHGRIDVLYLNAGSQFAGDTYNSDLRQMILSFDTNFWGAIRVLQAALPMMPKTGYGRILVTTSVESQWAAPNYLPYTASKWALMALQEEWYATHSTTGATTNIDFVAILPGTVNTSLGYHAIYGCPQILTEAGGSFIQSYTEALDPKAVGEAAYRLAVSPTPNLRNLVATDSQYSQIFPMLCRRYTQPLQNFYSTTGTPDISSWAMSEGQMHAGFNCSSTCGGAQYCGAGSIFGETSGRGSIVAYPFSADATGV